MKDKIFPRILAAAKGEAVSPRRKTLYGWLRVQWEYRASLFFDLSLNDCKSIKQGKTVPSLKIWYGPGRDNLVIFEPKDRNRVICEWIITDYLNRFIEVQENLIDTLVTLTNVFIDTADITQRWGTELSELSREIENEIH